MSMMQEFDVVVIGAGHAGIEATRALAKQNLRVALVTLDKNKIGAMSCNPAIGGVAKGHLVYEVDALGGLMGAAADLTGIQSRRLNLTKGPAVRSTRIQCDKDRYARWMSAHVPAIPGVFVIEAEASGILYNETLSQVTGVRLKDGSIINARAAVVTAGTFMRGLMFCGDERTVGGRYGDSAADQLTQSILKVGHSVARLKTGTPARLDAKTIKWSGLEKQWGDPEQRKFSWRESAVKLPQLCCYMTYTNDRTHDVIRANFHRSPLFSGDIVGVGPRYCPSVEDKIKRFPDRDRHQIFLEPEGLDTNSIYPNGLSTSLPADVQLEFLRSIAGLESVEILRPGYAVEYDTINPTELLPSFMSSKVSGLFFAGQVNRTSGYEEAAAQGLWAGMNAGLYLNNRETITPRRSRSYLETLADDLTTLGSNEPYRMFTSRSEYRLLLREDNAHSRLYDLANEVGLLCDEQKRWFETLSESVSQLENVLRTKRVRLSADRMISYFDYMKRPEIVWEDIYVESEFSSAPHMDRAFEQLEIKAKYSGYLAKQESEVRQLDGIREMRINPDANLRGLPSLSNEVVEKFNAARPSSVAELFGISGITPAAVLTIARVAGIGFRESSVSRETTTA